jgi:hypothetical protein
MGTTNMNDFKDKLAKSSKIIILNQFLQKYMFLSQQPTTSIKLNYGFGINGFNTNSIINCNDNELLKEMKYDNLLFENIKELWCHIDRINEFILLYQKDKNTTKDSIDYIAENNNNNIYNRQTLDTSYKQIYKDKLIRWLADNNMIVVDITNKKIEVKEHKQIIKENCSCKKENYGLYRRLYNELSYDNNNSISDYISGLNKPKYINCSLCGDEIINPNYNNSMFNNNNMYNV